VKSLLPLILFGLVATVFSLPAASADDRGDRDRSKAGAGASTEGGASLGGTGIDSGVANPRGGDDSDKRLKLQRKPKPVEEKQPPERSKPEAQPGNASSGATAKGSADLSEEVDKQDEEFRRKQDAARRK
jgi:hypothetical protein